MKAIRWIVAGSVAVFMCSGWLQARTWTSASNGKTLEGDLVSVEGSNLQIKLANGKVIKAPLTAFSKADQEFVAKQKAAPAKTASKAAPKPGDLEPVNFEIWHVRTCCAKSKSLYQDSVKGVEGVKMSWGKNSNGDKAIMIDAKTKLAAKEAMAKIAEAGLYGETTSHDVSIRGVGSKAKGDMKASGVAFCCNESVKALESALARCKGSSKDEKGVTEHTIKKSKDTFEIKGSTTASEVLRNARKVGFNFKLE